MSKVICGIYKITNRINGKIYIGQSVNIVRRWYAHKECVSNNHLSAAITKYGLENFDFEIIEQLPTEKLDEREQFWIAFYNSTDPNCGYNNTSGGVQSRTFTESARNQMSISAKAQRKTPTEKQIRGSKITGQKNKGRKNSAETRRRMQESAIRSWTPERRTKASEMQRRRDRTGNKQIFCLETGQLYANQKIAASKLGLDPKTVSNASRSNNKTDPHRNVPHYTLLRCLKTADPYRSLCYFIKENPRWQEILSAPPFNIIIKAFEDYILLKYNQLSTVWTPNLPFLWACRGSILKVNNGEFSIVCAPFSRFFNYGEQYADSIDWDGARVLDKIDGSLTKLWFDKGHWHWSTNGNIDADKTEFAINDLSQIYCPYKTFGELIRTAVNYKDLDFNNLNKNFTYMFELVSPYTKIVIPYSETKLYHLATRDNTTFEELEMDIGVEKPKSYDISTIDDCVVAAEKLSSDYEGFVVVDKNYNRIKIKNPKYLMMHRMASNNSLSIKNILEMIKINECSEFLSYFPEYKNAFNIVDQILKKYYFEMNKEYYEFKEQSLFLSRKEIAEKINSNAKWKDYLFSAIYKNETDAEKYLFEMKGDRLLNLVREDYKKMMEKKDADTYFIHNVWTASVGEDNQG